MGIQGNVPQKGLEGLPLFSLEKDFSRGDSSGDLHTEVSQQEKDTKLASNSALNSIFFDPEVLLDAAYNNPSRKEKNSRVYLLAVDTSELVPTFRIKIEHNYEVEKIHSYTRGYYTHGTSGPRDTFVKKERKSETSYYMIKSTYWKRRPMIQVYNGQKRLGNQVVLDRDSLSQIVSEISQLASERDIL